MGPTGPVSGDDDGNDEHRPSGSDLKVALIGAAATILAAVIAAVVAVNTNAVEISLPQGGPSRDDLSESVTSLEDENESLRADKADLQQRLDQVTAVTNLPTTSPPPPGPIGVVARQDTGLPLNYWHGLDLDSTASDWGVTGEIEEMDIYLRVGVALEARNAAQLAVMPKVPSFAECQHATGLKDGLYEDETVAGTQLCVRTTEGAYAYVGIVNMDNRGSSVTLDVTLWK